MEERQKHSLGQGEWYIRQRDSQFWSCDSAKCSFPIDVHPYRAGTISRRPQSNEHTAHPKYLFLLNAFRGAGGSFSTLLSPLE